MTALELARTFWKKPTMQHAEHFGPAEQATPDRYARHHADMGRSLRHPDATAMLADHALCERVVEWNSRVFARQWARCDPARPGEFRLLSSGDRRAALARDWTQMRAMLIAAPPEIGVVAARLADAELALNARTAS